MAGWVWPPSLRAASVIILAWPGSPNSPGGGHSLTIDSGWAKVTQAALDFIKRFA